MRGKWRREQACASCYEHSNYWQMLLVKNFLGEKERWWGRGEYIIQANDLWNKLGVSFGLSLQCAGGGGAQRSKSTYSSKFDSSQSGWKNLFFWSSIWMKWLVKRTNSSSEIFLSFWRIIKAKNLHIVEQEEEG